MAAAALAVLFACGNAIANASNCLELIDATQAAIDEQLDAMSGEELEAFRKQVSGVAERLIEEALARGAEDEAPICLIAADRAAAASVRPD